MSQCVGEREGRGEGFFWVKRTIEIENEETNLETAAISNPFEVL